MSSKHLIWIEPLIENEDNQEYLEELKAFYFLKIQTFSEVGEGINAILNIKFEDTIIIIGGEIIDDFFQKLQNKIDDLNVVPKTIIFSGEEKKKEIEKNKRKFKSYPFFNLNFVFDDFTNVKEEILKEDDFKSYLDDSRFDFEYIESEEELTMLVNYYKFIILADPLELNIMKFNQSLYNQFKSEVVSIYKLLRNTFSYYIPQKLLIKYWLKLYSINDFATLINENLRKGIGNEFGIYSQMFYIALDKNLIQPCFNQTLYKGGIVKKRELKKIREFKKRKDDFHGYTCYTKIFFSFTPEKDVALDFINKKKDQINKKEEELVIFTIEEGKEYDNQNATNTNFEEYSSNPENKEILFFPYSCFEILEISNNDEAYTDIKLEYFGKYKERVPNKIEDMKNIPESQFVKDFLSSQICSSDELEKAIEKNPQLFTFDINKYKYTKKIEIEESIKCKKIIIFFDYKIKIFRK